MVVNHQPSWLIHGQCLIKSHGNGSTPSTTFTPFRSHLGCDSGLTLPWIRIHVIRRPRTLSRTGNTLANTLIYPDLVVDLIRRHEMDTLHTRRDCSFWMDEPLNSGPFHPNVGPPNLRILQSDYCHPAILPSKLNLINNQPRSKNKRQLRPRPHPFDITGSIPSRIQARRSRRWRCRKVCVDDPVYPGTCESRLEVSVSVSVHD